MKQESTLLPIPAPVRWSTWALLASLLLLVIASFATLPLKWGEFFSADAVRTSADFLHGFAPPELAPAFLTKVGIATFETLAMSAIGTVIAALLGALLALPASGRFGKLARNATRAILNVLRSIPELVWASILLIAAGLGPFAGTLALALHTVGVLGRLFADAFENCPPLPAATLRMNGARPAVAFLYATLPQVLPQLLSYTLYRWENNIRAAAVLGVVGAGGLGQMLAFHMGLFQMGETSSILIAMLFLVALVDGLSFASRRWLAS